MTIFGCLCGIIGKPVYFNIERGGEFKMKDSMSVKVSMDFSRQNNEHLSDQVSNIVNIESFLGKLIT